MDTVLFLVLAVIGAVGDECEPISIVEGLNWTSS
jgi:hypothetical protein